MRTTQPINALDISVYIAHQLFHYMFLLHVNFKNILSALICAQDFSQRLTIFGHFGAALYSARMRKACQYMCGASFGGVWVLEVDGPGQP